MKLTFTFILVAVIFATIGYFVGRQKGEEIGFFRGQQIDLSIDELKNKILAKERNEINQLIKGSAHIETKDEGGLFNRKDVHYFSGTLTNKAIMATAKDVNLQISFLSKTNSIVGSRTLTIYEFVKPGQTINFNERIDIPENMESFKFIINDVKSN